MKLLPICHAITAIGLVLLANNVVAHALELHKKDNAEKPNCGAMDHSKMDMNDPVTQAIMKQCMDNHYDNSHHGDGDKQQGPHDMNEKPNGDGHDKHGKSGYYG
ncbi:hypothetical protein AB835_06955 [Candidatus Endobugula sertula]|uniref:Uncharacterized protein n=1 Tax=Candidatus Endobugula sertula TaxID=62101 RepID=A0A1D2QQG8_9GAMM|nr:hypothetical protein AB835_06955 [Candidatus Endobugula sertula]